MTFEFIISFPFLALCSNCDSFRAQHHVEMIESVAYDYLEKAKQQGFQCQWMSESLINDLETYTTIKSYSKICFV